MKQLTKDPWEEVAERYPVGKRVSGTVVRFADYGAFLRLEKDINGLVHLSEIAHHKVADPSEALTIGQKVEAQVINIDIDERRIGLSIKALQPIDRETLERIKKEQEEADAKKGADGTEGTDKTDAKPKKAAKKQEEAGESEEAEESAEAKDASAPTEGFVASKDGKKYYAFDSASGKKIKADKRVTFKTAEEAEAAGYKA
jgi:predicted RNA-binding protein with RPS1 domain